MTSKIPFITPEFPPVAEIIEDYKKILESNWFTNFGPFEKELCTKASQYLGNDVYVTTVANATLGLLLAIKALLDSPSGKKDQILLPSFTFPAAAEAIIWCGFKPVFLDINATSLQPEIEDAKSYLADRIESVAAILLCNTFGVGGTNMEAWEELGQMFSIPIIIDSAAGFGSLYPDMSKLGYRGDCEVFSLHATKLFAIGEGGVVASRSKPLIDKIAQLENFGFDSTRTVQQIGINAKLEELNCAIGLKQLDRLDGRIRHQQTVLKMYKQELEPKGFSFQDNDENSTVPFATVVAPSAATAKKFVLALQNNNIEVRNYYNPPLHQQTAISTLSGQVKPNLVVTEDVCARVVSLPSHGKIDERIVKFITALAPD